MREKESKQGGLFKEFGQDYFMLLIIERGDSFILPFRISTYHSKPVVCYPDFREFEYHTQVDREGYF